MKHLNLKQLFKRLFALALLVQMLPLSGIGQVTLVGDLRSGAANGKPRDMVILNNTLYMAATTTFLAGSSSGSEIAWWDGTQFGLIDIRTGNRSSHARNLAVYNNKIYFSADTSGTGHEFWETDGTTFRLVADINVGSGASEPEYLTEYNGILYFSARGNTLGKELYQFNGTAVSLAADVWAAGNNSSSPAGLFVFNNELFFSADGGGGIGRELYAYNGTSVRLVADIRSGSSDSDPQSLMAYNGDLYFSARGASGGRELYVYDGTSVSLVADIDPGLSASDPQDLTVYNGRLYFSASQTATASPVGRELFVYDGSAVTLVADIYPGVTDSDPDDLYVFNNKLYYSARDILNGNELRVFDGTNDSLVANIRAGGASSNPTELIEYMGDLYFQADSNVVAEELFRYQPQRALSCGFYDFDFTPLTTCPGDTFFFTQFDTPPANAQITWTFGDGTTSTDVNPTKIWNSPGLYPVRLTVNVNGCPVSRTTHYVEVGFVRLNAGTTNPSTAGGNDGAINLLVGGGLAPFTYQWSNGETTQDLDSLTAGTYSVTVTNNQGCSDTLSVTLTDPQRVESCLEDTLTFVPDDTNSTRIYTWNFGDGNASNDMIARHFYNNPGTYTVSLTVLDTNGCASTTFYTLNVGSLLIDSIARTNVLCFGDATGSATAYPSGGTQPYSYQWSNGGTTQTITGLTAGTYTVTVTDSVGCVAIDTVIITQPPTAVSASASGTDANCFGGLDGTATVTANGGVAPYTYLWSTGATTSTVTGLAAGTYTVTVTDANGCTDTASVTIGEANPIVVTLVAQESCSNDNSGTVTTTVSGGTAPYTYLWNTGATTANLVNVGPGTYTVRVTDANGCSRTVSITLTGLLSPNSGFIIQR